MSGSRISLANIENLARSNKWTEVEYEIRKLDRKYFLSGDLVRIATMARRAYQLSFALYLLKPLALNPDRSVNISAPADALSEYAICQIMLGGRVSAQRILRSVSLSNQKCLFAWVTLHFSAAEYSQAIPYLEKMIDSNPDQYQKMIGKLNLCACFVGMGQYKRAGQEIQKLQEELKRENYGLLLLNSHELLGQVYIFTDQIDRAMLSLSSASQLTKGSNTLYSLFVEKWKLVCQMKLAKVDIEEVQKFIEKAQKMDHYHSVRDILFFWSMSQSDHALKEKLYFGTSFASYRSFISSATQQTFDKQSCLWNGEWNHHTQNEIFYPIRSLSHDIQLSTTEISLIDAMTRDIVEPKSISSIFFHLWPDEFFDPEYSVSKSYKIVQRLNKKFSGSNVKLQLKSEHKKYSLKFNEGWAVALPHPSKRENLLTLEEVSILERVGDTSFSRSELMQSVGMTKSSSLRLLESLIEKGAVEKIGQGPGSFYRTKDVHVA